MDLDWIMGDHRKGNFSAMWKPRSDWELKYQRREGAVGTRGSFNFSYGE